MSPTGEVVDYRWSWNDIMDEQTLHDVTINNFEVQCGKNGQRSGAEMGIKLKPPTHQWLN